MSGSILTEIKDMLDIDESDTSFDITVIIHINSALMDLNMVGIGVEGFEITDASDTWSDFLGDNYKKLSSVKSVVYMSTKLVFDPPNNSFKVTAMKEELEEKTWKLSVRGEEV